MITCEHEPLFQDRTDPCHFVVASFSRNWYDVADAGVTEYVKAYTKKRAKQAAQ